MSTSLESVDERVDVWGGGRGGGTVIVDYLLKGKEPYFHVILEDLRVYAYWSLD